MKQATPAMGDSRENKEAREGERGKEAAPRLSTYSMSDQMRQRLIKILSLVLADCGRSYSPHANCNNRGHDDARELLQELLSKAAA